MEPVNKRVPGVGIGLALVQVLESATGLTRAISKLFRCFALQYSDAAQENEICEQLLQIYPQFKLYKPSSQ
jgi:hypothetical protein